MLARTAFALLLLLPAVTTAQDLDTAVSAVVRISGTRGGTPVRGSGFVVALDRRKATIVTASHVIEGVQKLEVTFAADLAVSFRSEAVLGVDKGNPHGLAVFQVRGALPAGVTTLSFEVESQPRLREALFLLGFPQMARAPRMAQGRLSARSGTLLLIDHESEEGLSGGPVLQDGKVVGVVTNTDAQTTYAINAVMAREALQGWGVKLGGQSSIVPPTKPAPAELVTCRPGEERTEAGIVFVRICPGTFTMGSSENDRQASIVEKPAHQVTLSEFWIGKTEITNEQYRGLRGDHQSEAQLPATEVTRDAAAAACEHFGGSLPTEAEWEYAARAGSQTPWSFGNDEKMLGTYAWYKENSGNMPHPVGTKNPNAWGLYDMHGNVEEWVADRFYTYPEMAQIDPSPKTGWKLNRIVRGGSFAQEAWHLRSTSRNVTPFPEWNRNIGFRCVRAPHSQP